MISIHKLDRGIDTQGYVKEAGCDFKDTCIISFNDFSKNLLMNENIIDNP